MIKLRKAFIVGIKGKKLNNNEVKFLKKYKPWGVILFSRNIYTQKQTKLLTKSIRKIFNDMNYPILIDEEGGKVTRLNRLIDTSMFSNTRSASKSINLDITPYPKTILSSIGL